MRGQLRSVWLRIPEAPRSFFVVLVAGTVASVLVVLFFMLLQSAGVDLGDARQGSCQYGVSTDCVSDESPEP